jgi:hypothetical protein
MPSISERFRRPLDESMLLRLVMVSGLMRGSDLARFYTEGGGGLDGSESLEEFLLANGVDAEQLKIVRRAYVETHDFGSTLVRTLHLRHAGADELRALDRALDACETEQLLQIRRGETPMPIGEMLVERGLLSREDLQAVIVQQGMLSKIERYTTEARERTTLAGRWNRARDFLADRVTSLAVIGGLLLVVLVNLWLAGAFERRRDPFDRARTPEQHAEHLRACYRNMLDELRRRQPDNAGYYRETLERYLQRLDESKVVIEDPEVARIRRVARSLDFDRLGTIPAGELPGMSAPELERRLAGKP